MRCAHCGKTAAVMMTVEAGRNQRPLELCARCWKECLDRAPLGNIPKRYRDPEDAGRFFEDEVPPPRTQPVGTRDLGYTGGIQYVPDSDGYW